MAGHGQFALRSIELSLPVDDDLADLPRLLLSLGGHRLKYLLKADEVRGDLQCAILVPRAVTDLERVRCGPSQRTGDQLAGASVW